MKKLMLGALAALCAMLVLPALAAATPAHIEPKPEPFTIHGGPSELSRVAGGTTTGTTTTGTGSFENTTTGTIKLTFHHVTSVGFTCTTAGQPAGTVTTTKLPFHLISDGGSATILITSNTTLDANGNPIAGTEHFATYNCGIFIGNVVVKGNGVIGSITSPKCGEESTTATVKFTGASGVQNPLIHTGAEYSLKSSVGGGAYSQSAMNAEGTITLAGKSKLVCT